MGRLVVFFGIFLGCISALGQSATTTLGNIRAQLEEIRADAPKYDDSRGASPALTNIKHELREWVESRLDALHSDPNAEDGAELKLADILNAELEREHLFRKDPDEDGDFFWKGGGFLAPLELRYIERQSYLLLQTSLEVVCGYDESAYLYRYDNGHWKRIWETEQNTYTKEGYKPQFIRSVLVSPPLNESTPYVMTLGTEPWCSSNWHDVYVRIWKVGPADSRLLLDKAEWAFLGTHDIPIMGSIGREDALVEYTTNSADVGVFSRQVVLHYSLASDKVTRIDPLALSPREFVDAWLAEDWSESRRWSERPHLAGLKAANNTRGRNNFMPTRSCSEPDLWQVGMESDDNKPAPVYFLVRWRPPYKFRMVQSSRRPFPNCKTEDPKADEPRTLFPVQDWRE